MGWFKHDDEPSMVIPMSENEVGIDGLAHLGLNVRDPKSAAKWYCDILGMKEVVTGCDSHGEEAVFLSFGSRHHDVVLIKARDPAPRKTGDVGMHHAAFSIQGGIEGLRRLYGRLLKNNVEVFKIADHAIGIGVYFFDPDGNKLEFFHDMFPDEKGLEGQMLLRQKGAPTVSIELTPIY